MMSSSPGRPGVATFLPLNYHWSTLLHMEVVRSVAPILHSVDSDMKRCKSSAHSCVKDPLRKCNKVATYFALLVDLGSIYNFSHYFF